MTVRINFLPRNYQPPKQMGAKEWGIVAAVAVGVLATGGYYSSVFAATAGLERQVVQDKARLTTIQAQLAEAEDIKARETRVTQAETDLKALAGRHWSGVLLTLAQLTPQHVSWTSLDVKSNNITLKGTGRGLVDVAQLMGGLVTEQSVDMVALRFINEKGMPVVVTLKPGDKSGVPDEIRAMGTARNLEFEMVITLVAAEGRQVPNGAKSAG